MSCVRQVCDHLGVTDESGAPDPDATRSAGSTPPAQSHPTRVQVVLAGLRSTSIVSLQFVLVVAAFWVLLWVIGKLWVILLPVLFAIIVSTD